MYKQYFLSFYDSHSQSTFSYLLCFIGCLNLVIFYLHSDPNKPERIKMEWPQYTLERQAHLNISRVMSVGQRLFERGYNFWTNVMPDLVKMAKGETQKSKNYCEIEAGCKP